MPAKRLDLTGQKFGQWTVVREADKNKRGQRRWLCQCTCGKSNEVTTAALRSGGSKSCGCSKEKPLDRKLNGRKFGRLTVVGDGFFVTHGIKKPQRFWSYNCVCDCGEKRVVSERSLWNGTTKSCGCARKDKWSEYLSTGGRRKYEIGMMAWNHIYNRYKKSAAERGLEFNLTIDDVVRISSMDCHYCGSSPVELNQKSARKSEPPIAVNGIDRVDNDHDYNVDSVVPCCRQCNFSKADKHGDDFIAMCHAVASRHPLATTSQTASVLNGPWADRNIDASPLQWAVQ